MSPTYQDFPNYSVYFAGDAYSISQKIMGRQSAGRQLIRGLAQKFVGSEICGVGTSIQGRLAFDSQLRAEGYQGNLRFEVLPSAKDVSERGTLYYPAPPTRELAHWRERVGERHAFSLMGVTHTLSSKIAADQIADMQMPPFQTWDALICTSKAAETFVRDLQEEIRTYYRDALGATQFNDPQLPVIPLGINASSFDCDDGQRLAARAKLSLGGGEVVFLFAGRLSFHAKANPLPMYWALEQASIKLADQQPTESRSSTDLQVSLVGGAKDLVSIVCLEVGVFPNQHIERSFKAAQKAIAPHVRFITLNGQDEVAYRTAWQAANVFVSLSDNIQETFGLTPVEAMAAGLPVLISDWNGYRDTVRHEIDGFRVPTIQAPAGAGESLSLRYTLDVDTYDMYIGRASLATVVEPVSLARYTLALASNAVLRQQMGAEGRSRARLLYDWNYVLDQYNSVSEELGQRRKLTGMGMKGAWPSRSDPFKRFAHFSTGALQANFIIRKAPDAEKRLVILSGLSTANYGFDDDLLPRDLVNTLLGQISRVDGLSLSKLIEGMGGASETWIRALMWLWKFDLIRMTDH